MTRLNEIYKCSVCGNIVGVVHESIGELVCCGKKMLLMEENTVDAATEKHVPVTEETEEGILVRVGEVAHPMEEEHYIEWIELLADGVSYRAFLKPGQKPKALFPIKTRSHRAREYCNLHGLWSG